MHYDSHPEKEPPGVGTNWRAVPGYEGYYEISNDGMVRSRDRYITDRRGQTRKLRGRWMQGVNNGEAFLLSRDGIERLVRREELVG